MGEIEELLAKLIRGVDRGRKREDRKRVRWEGVGSGVRNNLNGLLGSLSLDRSKVFEVAIGGETLGVRVREFLRRMFGG